MKNLLAYILVIFTFNMACSQTEIQKVNNTVEKNNMESHIYFLASDELKGREVGTPEIDIAASYLANMLRKYGVKPIGKNNSYYQNVPFEKTTAPTTAQLTIAGKKLDQIIFRKPSNINFTGKAIFLKDFNKDLKNADVKGKWILTELDKDIRNASRQSKSKMELAVEKGVLGFIEVGNISTKQFQRYAHFYNEPKSALKSNDNDSNLFTHLWASDSTGLISKLKSLQEVELSVLLEGVKKTDFFSRNVIGYIEGSDPQLKNEYVIFSAHYDHIGIGEANAQNDSIYNGARDNAVGTVTVLSAAENIGKYPTRRSSLFILFTAEEKGLLGSKYYVENPVVPLNQMVFCFNSDNGGYNDITKTTIIGLGRTTEKEHIVKASKEAGLTAIDDPSPEQGLFDRSDNVHFAKKGIPSPTFSMGFTTFDEEIEKYYHQTSDNPDSMDYDYLEKFFKAYVLSCRYILNDPEKPFWKEGDKYYKKGVELYNTTTK